jgi:hypothetical protein
LRFSLRFLKKNLSKYNGIIFGVIAEIFAGVYFICCVGIDSSSFTRMENSAR